MCYVLNLNCRCELFLTSVILSGSFIFIKNFWILCLPKKIYNHISSYYIKITLYHPTRRRRGSVVAKLAFWRRKHISVSFFAHNGDKRPNFVKISLPPLNSTVSSIIWHKNDLWTSNTAQVMISYVKSWITVTGPSRRFSVRPRFPKIRNGKCKSNLQCKILSSITSCKFYLSIWTLCRTK